MGRNAEALEYGKQFLVVQRERLAANPEEVEEIRFFADSVNLVKAINIKLGNKADACALATEMEIAFERRDKVTEIALGPYEENIRAENIAFLEACD